MSEEGKRRFTLSSGGPAERRALTALQLVDCCQLLAGPEDSARTVLGRVLLTHSWPSLAPPTFSLGLRWSSTGDGVSPQDVLKDLSQEVLKGPTVVLFSTQCASLGGIFSSSVSFRKGNVSTAGHGSFIFCACAPGPGVKVGEEMTSIDCCWCGSAFGPPTDRTISFTQDGPRVEVMTELFDLGNRGGRSALPYESIVPLSGMEFYSPWCERFGLHERKKPGARLCAGNEVTMLEIWHVHLVH